MAYHLETHPQVKAVVNFVPILLDQLENYAEQFYLGQIRDPLLRLLVTPDLDQLTTQERLHVFNSCFLSNHEKMLKPYLEYRHLHELYNTFNKRNETELAYFSRQNIWRICWCGITWRGRAKVCAKTMKL